MPLTQLIHSADSSRLLKALDAEATRQKRTVDVLLQCNTSGEASKQGFAPDGLNEVIPTIQSLRNVHVLGLMTMAAPQDPEQCRPGFAQLRELRDELRKRLDGSVHDVRHLSMGMSNDFEVAVEEGATLLRLGTILFSGLEREPT